MVRVIDIRDRAGYSPGNRITRKPWEFRWSCWRSKYFIQIPRTQALQLERQGKGHRGQQPPAHTELRGGMAYTVQAAFTYRDNEEKMRDVYYLAGLIDCMINRVSPLLRTDLIRHLYSKVMTMKGLLNITWYGAMDQVLLPLDERLFSDREYRETLGKAASLKALYGVIREASDAMFDILSREYVFYTPCRGDSNGKRIH